MTFSIVAADPDAGDWGIAVASRFPCVGAVVPWARAGVGAVATQSWANTAFGPDGLALMEGGSPAEDALRRLLDGDGVAMTARSVSWTGPVAPPRSRARRAWTGPAARPAPASPPRGTSSWAGVVTALVETYTGTEGDLCDRLLAALLAGDAAGGDRRGRQSAALLVVREAGGYESRNDRYIDLRVDDHPEAPTELARLFGVWDTTMLIRKDPLLPATPELVADLQRRLSALGRFDGEATGSYDAATRAALAEWAGEFNLEGRLRDDGQLSNLLVAEIRDVTPEIAPPEA